MRRNVNKDFFKTWSPEMAYVFGYFAADGGMTYNARGAYYLEFNSADEALILLVRILLDSNHMISKRVRKKEKWKQIYRLQIGSKEMFEDLLRLGMTPAKSKTLQFPEVPNRYLKDFVRGYFDGDGCIYFKKHFAKDRSKMRWVFQSRFTSGCRTFLKQLHETLINNGIQKGFIYVKKRGYDLVFSHHDSIALYNLMYNNAPAGLQLKRKRDIFEEAIRTLYSTGT